MISYKTILTSLIFMLLLSCGTSKTVSTETDEVSTKSEKMNARQEARQQLLADLNLREDQKLEVQTIVKESQEKMQSIQNAGGDRRSKMQQLRVVSSDTDTKLRTILDDTQYEIYLAYKEKQREQMREKMQSRGGRRGGF